MWTKPYAFFVKGYMRQHNHEPQINFIFLTKPHSNYLACNNTDVKDPWNWVTNGATPQKYTPAMNTTNIQFIQTDSPKGITVWSFNR